MDYAVKRNAQAILRGMRAVSDFEYEFQMALMNRKLNRDVQTVFLMTGLRWIFTSSSIIKEAVKFGGDIESMVPAVVYEELKKIQSGNIIPFMQNTGKNCLLSSPSIGLQNFLAIWLILTFIFR
ncbi:MAG: hypothetical protein R2874_12925 [Desulfobacterales bacterium]